MKKNSGMMLSRVAAALLLSVVGLGLAQASDDDKLKELERAMNAPSETGMVKPKMRTRAIVFDNQPQTGQQAAESATTAVAAAGPRDCAGLPPDVKSIGVDFEIQFNVGSATVSPASSRIFLSPPCHPSATAAPPRASVWCRRRITAATCSTRWCSQRGPRPTHSTGR